MVVVGWQTAWEPIEVIGRPVCRNCHHHTPHVLVRKKQAVKVMFVPVAKKRGAHAQICLVCSHVTELSDADAKLWIMRTQGDEDARLVMSSHLTEASSRIAVARAWIKTLDEIGDTSAFIEALPDSIRTNENRMFEALWIEIARGIASKIGISMADAEFIVFEDRFNPDFYVAEDGTPRIDAEVTNAKIRSTVAQAWEIHGGTR